MGSGAELLRWSRAAGATKGHQRPTKGNVREAGQAQEKAVLSTAAWPKAHTGLERPRNKS